MNRPLRTLLLAAGTLAACAPAGRAQSRPAAAVPADTLAARVTAVADEFVQKGLARFPEIATRFGLPGMRHDGLSDNTLAAITAWQAQEDDWRRRLDAVDAAALRGRTEGLTLGMLRESLEGGRGTRVCRSELWGVSQLSGWQVSLPTLGEFQPVGTAELRSQALARWSLLPRYIDRETERLREGVRLGYTAPKVNVRRVIQQLDALLASDPAASPFAGPIRRDTTAAFRAAMVAVVRDSITPAIRRHRDYLRDEYLPAAREAIAVTSLPNGEACYRAMVRSYTTIEVPPREIHRIGLEQMAKIDAEMATIARRSFGTGDVPALLERLKTDTAFTFRTRQDVVAYAGRSIEKARREMPRWFGRLPKADVEIRPYAEFEERSAPMAAYDSPAADGSRPGIYRINTFQPERISKAGMESTAFHEAIPGHHLQLAIAQERTDGHIVTRFLGNSGFSEGWGLYAERLADEMGLFGSDLDRMGLLSNEALRAARLVVDPGLHVMGWTRDQAIEYMLRHTAESRTAVENEVDRYVVWPGQATAYMLGSLEIRRLREQAQRELGPRFDIRTFHDRVLEDGTVTLPMLREKIERWIAETNAPAR